MLRVTGPGRAEVESPTGTTVDATALDAALDAAFAGDVTVVAWWVPVGDWAARRTAWALGFAQAGVLRGWADGQDAWAFTLRAGDAREPRTRWLENPVIEGDGVRLRPLSVADAPRVVEGLGDRDTQHWLSFMPRDPGPAEGAAYVETARERLADNHTVTWGFAATDDDLLLGAVGLYRFDVQPELGYWAHPDARGRGLTTRAAALALDHAFGALALDRLAAYVAAGNLASMRVLESLGMTPTGTLRRGAVLGDGSVVDLVGYDLLAEEWTSRR